MRDYDILHGLEEVTSREYKIAYYRKEVGFDCLICTRRISKGNRKKYQSWTCESSYHNWWKKPKCWKNYRKTQYKEKKCP